MQEILRSFAEAVSLACGLATVLVIGIGAAETILRAIAQAPHLGDRRVKKRLWVGFAGWILLALEFALAADIAETAIDPSWEELGKLAAIAAIRTLLNFFLEQDVEKSSEPAPKAANA